MTEKLRNLFKSTEEHKKRFMLLCVLTGLAGGALAIAFHLSISGLFKAVWKLGGALGEENRWWVMPFFPALGGLVAGAGVFFFAKSAAGSGIPQTKAAFYNNFGLFRLSDIFYRFVFGVVFCGFGNSAGREGPTVHMCSAAGSVLAQKMGFAKPQVRDAVPVGMASGIAASFNAPLSAISFVYEELFGGLGKMKNIGGVVVAVAIAAALARIVVGENPVINVSHASFRTGWWMLVCLPIAVCAGFAGDFFLSLLLKLRGRAKSERRIPKWLLPCLGGLSVGVAATFAYYITGYDSVFSVGYNVLVPAFDGDVAVGAMLVIFVFKFACTIVNYALGGSGGLFSPALVIGGTLGGCVGGLFAVVFGLDSSVIGASVMLGMGACFASIIRCPVTSIIMVFELTLNYSLILPLLAGNFIAYCIAKRRHAVGLYDSLLMQDGVTLKKMTPYRGAGDWRFLPIGSIMTYDPSVVSASETCAHAAARLSSKERVFRAYPVLDGGGALLGVANSIDIGMEANAEKKCADIARRGLPVATPDTSITKVANMLVDADLMEICLVSPSGGSKLVGIVTLHDIARQQNASADA